MIKKDLVQKTFVLIGIVLFLGVAFAPGITATRDIVENIELNSDLVEIGVEIENTVYTVLLTPDQAVELENLIERTKTRLDNATTMVETSRIFNETVVSLYELGMLPDGMSVEDAQRLVKGNNQLFRIGNVFNGFGCRSMGMIDDDENRFCLIAGETSMTMFCPLSYRLLFHIWSNVENDLSFILCYIIFFLLLPLDFLWLLSPVVYGNIVILGTPTMWGSPSRGWVRTIGLNGIKNWDGSFKGNMHLFAPGGEGRACLGIRGFNGISICNNISGAKYFYLGSASQVKIRNTNYGSVI